jgi:serine protease
MAPGGDSSSAPNGVVSSFWDANNPGSTNSYAYLAGTSMATPHVSGLVALLLAQGLSRDAAVQRVIGTTVDVPGCGASTCGHGRVNVATAVGTGSGGGTSGGGTPAGTSPAPSGGSGAPRVVRSPVSTAPRAGGTTTTAGGEGSTTTVAPAAAAQLPAGDNPVIAAGPPAAGTHHGGGTSSSRAAQVALAVGLLGVTGLGVSLGLLRLRGGAAP